MSYTYSARRIKLGAALPNNQYPLDFVQAIEPGGTRKEIILGVDWRSVDKAVDGGWRFKLGEFYGLVHGAWPEHGDPEARNRFPASRFQALCNSTGIFQGLRRPLHDGRINAESSVYVYVSKPLVTYEFRNHRDFGGVLKASPPPINSVLTTYISMAPNHLDWLNTSVHEWARHRDVPMNVAGVVLFWEWTECDAACTDLPDDYENRYDTRLRI